ncbi:MAG: hypothetical protein ACOYKC_01435 [Anaerolineaceae bacterium]|jgi:hypothetical protein
MQYDDDDGRTIVNMDVDGMPWHERGVRFAERQAQEQERSKRRMIYGERITAREARRYTFYALLAALAIVAVFAVLWAVVILFMTKVWFR